MAICKACNTRAFFTTDFSDVSLCKNCANLIRLSEWKDRNFTSMEELVNTKNNVLSIISSSPNMAQIKKSVEDYFNEYLDNGFVTSLDGKAGQKLVVFKDYCIVTTKSESKKDELISRFGEYIDHDIDDDDDDDDELRTLSNIGKLGKSLVKGNLVATGISMAAGSMMNEKIKEKKEEKAYELSRRKAKGLISMGDRMLNLKEYSKVETYWAANKLYGYVQFVPKGKKSTDMFECDYFFYNPGVFGQNFNLKKKIEMLKNTLNKMITSLPSKVENDVKEEVIQKKTTNDNFAEIRKYKELLDEGIITEEEFNQKKKDLLNL